jgi:hypothetical protein
LLVRSSILADQQGVSAGYIQGIVIDPVSGRVEYALASVAAPGSPNIVTPVPWPLLQKLGDAEGAGGTPGKFQKFAVPLPRATLVTAPRIDLGNMAGAADRNWMAASSRYFGAAAASVGAAADASGSGVGGAAGLSTTATGDQYAAPFFNGGGGVAVPETLADYLSFGTNLFGTNLFSAVFGTNFAGANLAAITNPAFSTNLFIALTNFFATNQFAFTNGGTGAGTNAFARIRTNFLATNFFARTTNRVFAPTNGAPGNVGAPPRNLPPQFGTNSGGTALPPGSQPPNAAPAPPQSPAPPGDFNQPTAPGSGVAVPQRSLQSRPPSSPPAPSR